ncbi:hypothetical protein CsSME_00007861 [Camellia sinensis var. sinensis]
MDLITSDPSSMTAPPPPPPSSSSVTMPPSSGMGKPAAQTERKSKRGTLMQIQSDTISAAKAALNPVRTNIMPQKQKKKVLTSISLSFALSNFFIYVTNMYLIFSTPQLVLSFY